MNTFLWLRIAVLFLSVLSSSVSFAQEQSPKGLKSYKLLQEVPVLDNGRLKPLDTYARNLLIQLSGKDTFERRPAIHWLAAVLFAPETTKQDKVFLINNPDIATALQISPEAHRRYSFGQIEKAYPKLAQLYRSAQNISEKERSIVENEIIRVAENVKVYADLSHEFLFALPHEDFSINSAQARADLQLSVDSRQFSFLDIALRADKIQAVMAEVEGKDKGQWTTEQRQTVQALSNLYQWTMTYKDLALRIIPHSKDPHNWLSPWDALGGDFRDQGTRELLVLGSNMVGAYWRGEQVEFDLAARAYLEGVARHLPSSEAKKLRKFSLELAYHAWRPFFVAKIFYILALVFFVISFMSSGRVWYWLSWAAVIGGFVPHLLALISRIIIMARPPVTNLYETFIFVALITVLLGIVIERVNKQWLGLVVAGISGTALLFIASRYSAEGDTLKMLIAVLNSNFWLGTHVTTITMGYGSTCVAGILGHIWLVQAVLKKDKKILDNTYSVMMGILGLALALTFLGTNLGGIWADQSWGRFWGWDPKENGALMIVLWSALLFHARIAKMIGPLGMAVGTGIGMIVVMWAWFGVNLLSIGLHSYGFTSGIANALGIYAVCEMIFFIAAVTLIRGQRPISQR